MLRRVVFCLLFSSLPALWAQTPTRLLNDAEVASTQGQPEKALNSIGQFLDQLKQGTVTGPQRVQLLDRAGTIVAGLREKDTLSVRVEYLLGEIRFLQDHFKEDLEVLNPIRSANIKNADYFNLVGLCLGGLNQLP